MQFVCLVLEIMCYFDACEMMMVWLTEVMYDGAFVVDIHDLWELTYVPLRLSGVGYSVDSLIEILIRDGDVYTWAHHLKQRKFVLLYSNYFLI